MSHFIKKNNTTQLFSFILLFCFVFSVSAKEFYTRPHEIDEDTWNSLTIYFLPFDHPAKEPLDKIFGASRAIANVKALKKAGFTLSKPKKWNNIWVGSHYDLKGYLIKTYTDEQNLCDFCQWMHRIEGSNAIRCAIEHLGYQEFFKVPKKWIYPIPIHPSEKSTKKHFLMVVEDMCLESSAQNKRCWKNPQKMSKAKLFALYTLLRAEGLNDCVYVDNIPFSEDGKIAFVDTEHFHHWPVKYDRLTPFIPLPFQGYWRSLFFKIN